MRKIRVRGPVLAAIQLSIGVSPIWSLALFGAGSYLFVQGFRLLSKRRRLLTTPQSKIRSAALGLVEVNGLAVGPYTLHAPITGKPSYFYRTIVWEYRQEGRSGQWKKVAEENLHVPFFLDDNTGRLLIDPRGAELDIHRDFRHEFSDSFLSMADPVPENVRTFLLRHGVSCEAKIRVEEYCIKPKNALFIVGTLAENPKYNSAANSPRTAVTSEHAAVESPEVIYLSDEKRPASSMQMTQQEKVAAALLKAGITKPAAWEAAGVSIAELALQESTAETTANISEHPPRTAAIATDQAASGFNLNQPVVLMRGQNDKTLLISWRSENALARSLALQSAAMLTVGPLLILIGVYLLNGPRLL